MAKIKIIEVEEIPICPFCKEELREINVNSKHASWSLVERHYVCFCPHCRRILSVSFTRSAF